MNYLIKHTIAFSLILHFLFLQQWQLDILKQCKNQIHFLADSMENKTAASNSKFIIKVENNTSGKNEHRMAKI